VALSPGNINKYPGNFIVCKNLLIIDNYLRVKLVIIKLTLITWLKFSLIIAYMRIEIIKRDTGL
jgi:hypothetical protein